MPRRQVLRDHPAHRRAADVRAAMPSASSTPSASSAMSASRVGRVHRQAERVAQLATQVRHAAASKPCSGRCRGCRSGSRESRASTSSVDQVVGPGDQLHAQAHDQQQRPPRGGPWSSTSSAGRWPDLHARSRAQAAPALPAPARKNQRRSAARLERLPLLRVAAPGGRRSRTAPAGSCPCRCGWLAPRCSRPAGASVVEAALPRDDAVAARVDRGRRAPAAALQLSPSSVRRARPWPLTVRRSARRWSRADGPANGVPSVTTQRESSGISLAISRA